MSDNIQIDDLPEPSEASALSADLDSLDFVGLMIDITGSGGLPQARYRPTYENTTNQQLMKPPEKYGNALAQLASALATKALENRNAMRFTHILGSLRLRVSIIKTESETWALLRRIPPATIGLEGLNISTPIIRKLREWTDASGLTLISGDFCTGKTTTASNLLIDYLKRNGGLGLTLESPAEYFLQGTPGDHALCLQIPLEENNTEQWDKIASQVRTAAPSIIYIGEVLTPTIARIAIDLAMTSRPVITTIFGADPSYAIDHLITLAANNDENSAQRYRQTLSRCLTGVTHQVLVDGAPSIRILNVAGSVYQTVRTIIASGDSLEEEIERQNGDDELFDTTP